MGHLVIRDNVAAALILSNFSKEIIHFSDDASQNVNASMMESELEQNKVT